MRPLRILPTAIAASAVAVPLYVIANMHLLGPAVAQPATPELTKTEQAKPEQTKAAPARPEPGLTDLLAPGAQPSPGSPAPASKNGAAPGACSPALADALAAEGLAQADRARDLEVRVQYLQAMEKRVSDQLAALEAARGEVKGLMDRRTSLAEDDLTRLVAIYENMKPKDAARLLNSQATGIVMDLLDRMRERVAAPILAEMEPTKVNDLTRALAERRRLQGDRVPVQAAPPAQPAQPAQTAKAAPPATLPAAPPRL